MLRYQHGIANEQRRKQMITQVKINVALLVTVPLTIWLAASGRIDWWTFGAVWASHISAAITFNKR